MTLIETRITQDIDVVVLRVVVKLHIAIKQEAFVRVILDSPYL